MLVMHMYTKHAFSAILYVAIETSDADGVVQGAGCRVQGAGGGLVVCRGVAGVKHPTAQWPLTLADDQNEHDGSSEEELACAEVRQNT